MRPAVRQNHDHGRRRRRRPIELQARHYTQVHINFAWLTAAFHSSAGFIHLVSVGGPPGTYRLCSPCLAVLTVLELRLTIPPENDDDGRRSD